MSYRFGMKMVSRQSGLPRLDLARATPINNRRKRSELLTLQGPWFAPAGVTVISIEGRGANGKPETGEHDYVAGYDTYRQRLWQNNTTGVTGSDAEVKIGNNDIGDLPADYCEAAVVNGNFTETYCYRYVYQEVDVGDYVPATAGSNSAGFGQTFAGGTPGQQAAPRYVNNIAVVPGGSYFLTIPAGGYITIYYD